MKFFFRFPYLSTTPLSSLFLDSFLRFFAYSLSFILRSTLPSIQQIVRFRLFVPVRAMVWSVFSNERKRERKREWLSSFGVLHVPTWIKLQLFLLNDPEFPLAVLAHHSRFFHLQTLCEISRYLVQFSFTLSLKRIWTIDFNEVWIKWEEK